ERPPSIPCILHSLEKVLLAECIDGLADDRLRPPEMERCFGDGERAGERQVLEHRPHLRSDPGLPSVLSRVEPEVDLGKEIVKAGSIFVHAHAEKVSRGRHASSIPMDRGRVTSNGSRQTPREHETPPSCGPPHARGSRVAETVMESSREDLTMKRARL